MGVTHNLILGGGVSLPTILNATVSGGTATSVTASLGSRSVSLAYVPGTSRLPSGYTELEYIEGGGPAGSSSASEISCIDTGIVPTATTRVVTSSKGEGLSGWGSAAYQEGFGWSYDIISVVSPGGSGINTGGSSGVINTYDLTGNGNLFFNGTNIGTGNIGNTASPGQTIYLMVHHVEWTSSGLYANGTLQQHRCQIYSGATLVRDLYPARRNSDSVLGMYDLVNNTFYTNAGSGSFTPGPEIGTPGYWTATLPKNVTGNWTVTATDGSKTVSDLVAIGGPGIWSMELKLSPLPSGYTELEYIISNKNAYINTGITQASNYTVEGSCYIGSNFDTNPMIYGSYQDFESGQGENGIYLHTYSDSKLCVAANGIVRKYTTITYNSWHQFQAEHTSTPKLKWDGVDVSFTNAYNYGQRTIDQSIFLFAACNRSGNPRIAVTVGLTRLKFYDGAGTTGALLGDFIPSKRNSDSAIGMYDTEKGVFLTSPNGNAFQAGPEV